MQWSRGQIKMSLKLESDSIKDGLTLVTIIGVLMVVGAIVCAAVGTALDHSWLLTGLSYMLPVFILGIVLIWIGVKVLEVMK